MSVSEWLLFPAPGCLRPAGLVACRLVSDSWSDQKCCEVYMKPHFSTRVMGRDGTSSASSSDPHIVSLKKNLISCWWHMTLPWSLPCLTLSSLLIDDFENWRLWLKLNLSKVDGQRALWTGNHFSTIKCISQIEFCVLCVCVFFFFFFLTFEYIIYNAWYFFFPVP